MKIMGDTDTESESADERVGRSRCAFVHAVEERREDRGVVGAKPDVLRENVTSAM